MEETTTFYYQQSAIIEMLEIRRLGANLGVTTELTPSYCSSSNFQAITSLLYKYKLITRKNKKKQTKNNKLRLMKGNHSKKKKVNIKKLLQSNVSMEMQSNVKREKYLP